MLCKTYDALSQSVSRRIMGVRGYLFVLAGHNPVLVLYIWIDRMYGFRLTPFVWGAHLLG